MVLGETSIGGTVGEVVELLGKMGAMFGSEGMVSVVTFELES